MPKKILIAWRMKPTAITIPIALIPIGISAIVMGDAASKAFDNLGGGTVIRVMGFVMVAGGIFVIIGIIKNSSLHEVIGLALSALGAAVYGAGVILGLKTQGIIAGLGYLAMAVAFLGRIQLLTRAAGLLRRDP
jgi:hypothetical protein